MDQVANSGSAEEVQVKRQNARWNVTDPIHCPTAIQSTVNPTDQCSGSRFRKGRSSARKPRTLQPHRLIPGSKCSAQYRFPVMVTKRLPGTCLVEPDTCHAKWSVVSCRVVSCRHANQVRRRVRWE